MTNGRDTSVESLRNHDGNGSENVTWKVIPRYFKLYYSRFTSWGILLELKSKGLYRRSENEKEFTSSINLVTPRRVTL